MMHTTKLTTMPIETLWTYREFKRDEVPAPRVLFVHNHDVEQITEYVSTHGIEPIELSIINDQALLTDGNHRIIAAKRLGFLEVPVKVTVYFGDGADTFYQHTLDRFKPINPLLELRLKALFL